VEAAAHALWQLLTDRDTQAIAERIILDPKYHDALAILKAARNGAVYGTKVRFPHALVYAPEPPNNCEKGHF
jgi:peroxisomal membrane protein 4